MGDVAWYYVVLSKINFQWGWYLLQHSVNTIISYIECGSCLQVCAAVAACNAGKFWLQILMEN